MIALVASGLYPIHIAAFAGAVSTVLFGSLTMEKAYRAIEWRALFLVAAVLPVGSAMENTGAANFLAELVVRGAEPFGPYAFLTALVVLSSLLSQGLDGAPWPTGLPGALLSVKHSLIRKHPEFSGRRTVQPSRREGRWQGRRSPDPLDESEPRPRCVRACLRP